MSNPAFRGRAAELRSVQRRLGIKTQAELAARLHVSESAVSLWFAWKRRVPVYILKFAQALADARQTGQGDQQ